MKKVYDFWFAMVVAIVVSIPAIAAILQIGHEAAKVAWVGNHSIVAFVILIATYVMWWGFFKRLDKVGGGIINAASGATGKMRRGLMNYSKNRMKSRFNEAIEGKRDVRGARLATNLVRRGRMAEQGGLRALLPGEAGARARAMYEGAEASHLAHTVEEMMKRDGGRSGGDDAAMEIAMQRGMTNARFVEEYSRRLQASGIAQGEADRRANTALSTLRSSFGAELGTDAMRVAAYRSLLDSKTSYADPDGTPESAQATWSRIIGDGNELMSDGLMTSTDVTMAIKSRADRADRSGVGFGGLQGQVESSFERYQGGARGQNLVQRDEAVAMRREALFGTGPGGVVAGRHEAVSALSGVMMDDIQQASQNFQAASQAAQAVGLNVNDTANMEHLTNQVREMRAQGFQGPLTQEQQAAIDYSQAQDQYMQELASTAGRYDAMSQISPQNAQIMANNVMSQVVTTEAVMDANGQQRVGSDGKPMVRAVTVQEMIERNRSTPGFIERRREYMNAQIAGAQAAQQAAAAGAGMPPPVGGAPGGV